MRTTKFIAGLLLVFAVAACNKPNSDGQSTMRVKMTDAPGPFTKVNVEIRDVEVSTSKGWISLPTNAGVYDLLTLQNDVTVVLANDHKIPSGDVSQMRLILGSHNNVLIGDQAFPLNTPSAMQSGLKFNINKHFEDDKDYELLIDFDANQSIVIEGDGSYTLKPALRLKSVTEI
ncbi:MAG: starch-binding domain-like protein [Crocinitomicaceae bacterium]|jgi:hypothetical protein|nr:starch-binding domain-like protein [Crocinitomicaceae bacterium]